MVDGVAGSHPYEAGSTQERTLDLELIRDTANAIEADTSEVLQLAEILEKGQAQAITNTIEEIQEIVAEIQADLSELPAQG